MVACGIITVPETEINPISLNGRKENIMVRKDVLLGELNTLEDYLWRLKLFAPDTIVKVRKAIKKDIEGDHFTEWRESHILCALEDHTDIPVIGLRAFEDAILDWADHMDDAGELSKDEGALC